MSIAPQVIDPDVFKVPYAMNDDAIFHIKHGRPEAPGLFCPICEGKVSFVKETDFRSAHFRHHSSSDCEQAYAMHRDSMHNAVRDATVALLNGRYVAKDICAGQKALALPTGFAVAEKGHQIDGVQYVPDITVRPKDGEAACTLELEVIWSSPPTPKRMHAAARDGRLIGVMNISSIEQSYMHKLWRGERFDIPEACKTYVLEKKFKILNDVTVRRDIRGLLDREYRLATVRREHRIVPLGLPTRPPLPNVNARSSYPQTAAPAYVRPEPPKPQPAPKVVNDNGYSAAPFGATGAGFTMTWTGRPVRTLEAWMQLSEYERTGKSEDTQ